MAWIPVEPRGRGQGASMAADPYLLGPLSALLLLLLSSFPVSQPHMYRPCPWTHHVAEFVFIFLKYEVLPCCLILNSMADKVKTDQTDSPVAHRLC